MNEWFYFRHLFVCLFDLNISATYGKYTYISYRLNCPLSIGSFLFREREREKKVSLKRPMNLQLACSWLKKEKRAHLCAHTPVIYFVCFRLFSKITDRPIILCLKMLFKLPKKMFNMLNLVEEEGEKVKYENERESFFEKVSLFFRLTNLRSR